MNLISSILRIICGLALIILAYSTHQKNTAHVAAGEPLQIFGITTGASSTQLGISFIVIGLIGLFLIILGVINLLKSRQ